MKKSFIGGFIGGDSYYIGSMSKNAMFFNTARNALLFYLKKIQPKRVFVPIYNCPDVLEIVKKNNFDVVGYHIDENLLPIIQNQVKNNDLVLITNYFGILDKDIKQFLNENVGLNCVIDCAQAYFSELKTKFPIIKSPRKVFPLSDGGVLENVEIDSSYFDLTTDLDSIHRYNFQLKRMEEGIEAAFPDFQKNELLLGELEIEKMSNFTYNLLLNQNFHFIKSQRKKNFEILKEVLGHLNEFEFIGTSTFCYPFFHQKAYMMKNELLKENVFIPKYWNIDGDDLNSVELRLVNECLCLPLHGSSTDMRKMSDLIVKLCKSA